MSLSSKIFLESQLWVLRSFPLGTDSDPACCDLPTWAKTLLNSSWRVLPSENRDQILVPSSGRASRGLRRVISDFRADPAVSNSLRMNLGCVQAAKLAQFPQPLKTGSPWMQSQFFGDSTKRMRGWRKPKITVLFVSTEGELLDFCAPLWSRRSSRGSWSAGKGQAQRGLCAAAPLHGVISRKYFPCFL